MLLLPLLQNFGPPGGKKMTIFMDDLSMPEINAWGDQPTLEMVRLIVEWGGFCFLDKDKRGDFKVMHFLMCTTLSIAASIVAAKHISCSGRDTPQSSE
jgi:P-loop containing dynein motor region